ncbi:hypothetical protein ACGFY9_20300 [Streptomyces sp. NPDC048504]|uniref:hypothetical protein n=1 Tax=Streptomyces sp. NPDC048504 TaxID=3365559 RepID=UPI00371F0D13
MSETSETELREAAAALRRTAERAAKPHARGAWIDSTWHNVGTGLAMAATTVATVLPGGYSTWTRSATGLATFLIAFLRAMDFGTRWRWHRSMRAGLLGLVDRVDGVAVLPPEQRAEELHRLHGELARIRAQDAAIPGTGAFAPAGDSPSPGGPVPPAR